MTPARLLAVGALCALPLSAGLSQAQAPPPERPESAALAGVGPAEGGPAEVGPEDRPAERPDAPAPQPQPQGSLIPPEADPPESPPPATDQPATHGRLIPPEEMPPIEPLAPAGPPAPELLRESDFDLAACKLELTVLGATYEDADPITDPQDRDCGIARPLRVTQILPGVGLEGGADMRCDTARALAHWTRDFVLPASSRLPNAPRLAGMNLGTTYFCRPVVGGASTSRLSEHALGNAIDIASFRFDDGTEIVVAPREDSGDLLGSFQAAVRSSACMDFTTVLGPGSNDAHSDHLHLDIKARGSGYRLCQ